MGLLAMEQLARAGVSFPSHSSAKLWSWEGSSFCTTVPAAACQGRGWGLPLASLGRRRCRAPAGETSSELWAVGGRGQSAPGADARQERLHEDLRGCLGSPRPPQGGQCFQEEQGAGPVSTTPDVQAASLSGHDCAPSACLPASLLPPLQSPLFLPTERHFSRAQGIPQTSMPRTVPHVASGTHREGGGLATPIQFRHPAGDPAGCCLPRALPVYP